MHLFSNFIPSRLEIADLMFFVLSKLLQYILLPFIWLIAVLVYAIITKRQKQKKKAIAICLLLLFFFGSSFTANQAFLWWEKPPVPIADLHNYQTAIVLTGVANVVKLEDRVYFSKGADRVLHTVQLYKLGKVKKILVSGGSGALTGKKLAEADMLKKVFIYCGVNEADIITESKSRNTFENAQFSKRLVDSLAIKGDFLLVTSAFHMRRAEACFLKAGFKIDSFPADFYTSDWQFFDLFDLVPSEGPFAQWTLLIHEITGYIVYKIMGYG